MAVLRLSSSEPARSFPVFTLMYRVYSASKHVKIEKEEVLSLLAHEDGQKHLLPSELFRTKTKEIYIVHYLISKTAE